MTPRSHASSVSSIAARYSSSSRNSRGNSGGAASGRPCSRSARREPLGPELELRPGFLGRQAEQEREGNDELGILAARRR